MKPCVCVCVRARARARETVGEKENSRVLFKIFPEGKRIIHINYIPTAHKSTQIENKMFYKDVLTNKKERYKQTFKKTCIRTTHKFMFLRR